MTADEAGDNLLQTLWELHGAMARSRSPITGQNLLERWDWFVRTTEAGRKCTFSLKAKRLFLEHDLPLVRQRLQEVQAALSRLEDSTNAQSS